MRGCFVSIAMLALIALTTAQEPATQPKSGAGSPAGGVLADSTLDTLEAKIKIEWEALKNKDRKAYGELLADDYQGVEIDGRGERNKIQSINELADENIYNYTLERFKLIPLGPDAACVIYESTMQFPPKAQVRFSRVYISELWVKREGQWKEVHYRETHVK